jgi:2-phosphoglycerate kinase
LVENNLLDIQSTDFQKYVFEIMKKYNYDEIYIDRYKMMNQFYTKRFPLIILVSGTLFIGKSTIATKLSERMNISNVLQTKVIADVMAYLNVNDSSTQSLKPFFMDENITTDEELIKRFEYESREIRKGANFDIQKAFTEGKSLIIEGHHIIPELYISKVNENLNICTPEPLQDNETRREKVVREEMKKLDQKGIIIPFILTTSEKNQLYLLKEYGLFFEGENISYNENEEKSRIRVQNLLNKFKTIQDYLLKQSQNFIVIDLDLNNLSQSLEIMQDYILEKILETYNSGSI